MDQKNSKNGHFHAVRSPYLKQYKVDTFFDGSLKSLLPYVPITSRIIMPYTQVPNITKATRRRHYENICS